MNLLTNETQAHWAVIAPILSIRNEKEYDRAITHLDQLLDEIGDNERHPLYGLLDALGAVIHSYEETAHSLPRVGGVEVLRLLMEEHDVKQSELPEVGSQGVVSEVLSGKRDLNTRQIDALSQRFNVSPAVFF